MATWLFSWLSRCWPPRSLSDEEAMYRWAVTISTLLVGSVIMQLIITLIAFGFFGTFGVSGFASARDLSDSITAVHTRIATVQFVQAQAIGEVKIRLGGIEAGQRRADLWRIDTSIRDDVGRICRAQTDDAKQYFTGRLHDDLMAWAGFTQAPYPMPTCDQLMTKAQ